MEFSNGQLESILSERYQIKATATLLYGEIELNYRVKCQDGNEYVLKISPSSASKKILETDQDLLLQLQEADFPFLLFPAQ